MTVEMMQNLSTLSYIVAAVMFVITVMLFFLLNVPRLIGDISGATARKAIESIRQQNEMSGDKAYKPSPVNSKRGRVTDRISDYGTVHNSFSGMAVNVGTEDLQMKGQPAAGGQDRTDETTVLSENRQVQASSETTVLSKGMLNIEESGPKYIQPSAFEIEYNIGFCGSTEVIE